MKRILLIRHLPDAKPPSCVCHPRWDCEHSAVTPQLRDPCLCLPDLCEVDADYGNYAPALLGDPESCSPMSTELRTTETTTPDSDNLPKTPVPSAQICNRSVSTTSPRLERLEPVIARFAPKLIVTSPLRRAVMTTGIIFQHYNQDVPIIVHPGAREKNHKGKLANWPVPLDQLRQVLRTVPRGPDMDCSLMEAVPAISEHEDAEEADQRIDAFMEWLLQRPEPSIAVVSHSGVIKHMLQLRQAPTHGGTIECIATQGRLHIPLREFLPVHHGSPLLPRQEASDLSFCFVQTLPWSPTCSPCAVPTRIRSLTLDGPDGPPDRGGDQSDSEAPCSEAGEMPPFMRLLARTTGSPNGADAGDLSPFSEQVSGRHLMFNTPDGILYKEADSKEVAFYNAITSHPHPLQAYIAEFFSVEIIHSDELLKAKKRAMERCSVCSSQDGGNNCAHSSVACRLLHNFDPQPDTVYQFLALRDVTRALVKPCVIDIKMGRRQYGYGASKMKIQSKELKTRKSTSRNLFFRVCGLKVYKRDGDHSEWLQKEEAQRITKYEMERTLANFLNNGWGLRTDVLGRLLPRLKGLFSALQEQRDWHFITSSLLLVYDGDPAHPERADICMIDFAHTEAVRNSLDTEYLYGLANLIDVLECILYGLEYVPPTTPPSPCPQPHITPAAVERLLNAAPSHAPKVVLSPAVPHF